MLQVGVLQTHMDFQTGPSKTCTYTCAPEQPTHTQLDTRGHPCSLPNILFTRRTCGHVQLRAGNAHVVALFVFLWHGSSAYKEASIRTRHPKGVLCANAAPSWLRQERLRSKPASQQGEGGSTNIPCERRSPDSLRFVCDPNVEKQEEASRQSLPEWGRGSRQGGRGFGSFCSWPPRLEEPQTDRCPLWPSCS